MVEPEQIISGLRLADLPPVLKGHKLLITAGPTREALDPVRYLTNRSSGRMGYALAEAAAVAGAEVNLISGPVQLPAPPSVRLQQVETAAEMHEAVFKTGCCLTAAVADYRIAC